MVSVIIVVYNDEKYIKQAIESVLAQTYKNIELIVVDDGSTDNTGDIVKQYENIIYIYQENRGEGAARNVGINNSHGEYLAFLDSDDIYEKNKIEKQLQILNYNQQVDVVYNDLKVVDENLNYLNTLKSEGIYKKREDLLANIIYRQVIQGPICMMIRRKCVQDIKWSEKLIYTVDYEYIIQLAQRYNFEYIPEELYIYRRHGNNLSNKHNETLKEERSIIKNLGLDKIDEIVNESSLNKIEKQLLKAKIYIKMEKYNLAINILKHMDTTEEALFYLGVCYYRMDKKLDSQKCYENLIQINDSMAEAYNNLSCCIYEENLDLAKKYLEKAITLKRGYIDARNNLEKAYKRNEKFKITEKTLRSILTLYN